MPSEIRASNVPLGNATFLLIRECRRSNARRASTVAAFTERMGRFCCARRQQMAHIGAIGKRLQTSTLNGETLIPRMDLAGTKTLRKESL